MPAFTKRLAVFLCLSVTFMGLGITAEAQDKNQKIVLMIKDVETPDTRAAMGKWIDVKEEQAPQQESALTEADRAFLHPYDLGAVRFAEVADRLEQNRAERAEVDRRNRKKEVIADRLRENFIGTDEGRNVIQAKDWLAEALTDYSDFIEIVDRSEQDLAMTETALNTEDQTTRGGVTHLLRIVVGDERQKKTTTTAYGAKTVQVQKSLNITVVVNDLNDRQVYTKSFEGKLARINTSYGSTTTDADNEELLRSALHQAAEGIAKHFTSEITVQLRPPRGEEDTFDPGMVSILLDGEYISDGEVVRKLAGTYEVSIESEDYTITPNPRKITVRSDQKIPITLQSAYGVISFAIPGNLGVDVNAVEVQLVDKDGNAEAYYGEGPHRLRKGNYALKARAEGCLPLEIKRVSVTRGTEGSPARISLNLKPDEKI